MARLTGPRCRVCRRLGKKLFLKGARCFGPKCPIEKGALPPGQHGAKRTRHTDFGIHLHETQRAKKHYGVLMRQFRRYFEIAYKADDPVQEIIRLLERRLDNVVYRLGFALSRAHARQAITHGHIRVNGKRVTIPSYLISPGDIIAPENKPKSIQMAKEALGVRRAQPDESPTWVKVIKEDPPEGQVVQMPDADETQVPFEGELIVEFMTR